MTDITFRQLFLQLTGLPTEPGQAEAEHRHGFVLLDRGLSPAGARRLRDRRCLGLGSSFPWPNPGVYSVPELALRVLREHERRAQKRVYPRQTATPLARVLTLLQNPARSPWPAYQLLRETKALAPLGVRGADWRDIILGFEREEDPEFQAWTERILAHIELETQAAQDGVWATEWSPVAAACDWLESGEAEALPWAEMLERRRSSQREAVEILVPAACEPYPLERRFLKAVARQLPVRWVRPRPAAEMPALETRALHEHEDKTLAIHWASFDAIPSATETAELIPGLFALDVAVPKGMQAATLARALYLFADYEEKQRPEGHPFLRGPSHRTLLVNEGLDPNEPFTSQRLLAFIAAKNPQLQRDLASPVVLGADASRSPDRPSEWARLLGDLGYLPTLPVPRAPTHQRLSPQGVSVLSLGDLALTGHARLGLWGSREKLAALCDPVSADNLKRRPLPGRLKSLFEAAGYIVPDPSEEALLLRGLLNELSDRIFLLAHTRRTPRLTARPLALRSHLDLTVHRSPSTFESFFRCPLRFFLERGLRLQASEEWDAPQENALKTGLWMHRCLELFFEEPDWERPETALRKLLQNSRDEFFAERSTGAYLRLLDARGEALAEQLGWHVRAFERPLQALRGSNVPAREIAVEGQAFGLGLRGFVDRVDMLDPRHLLVWDYKSGRVGDKKPESQFKNGKFQWFIYRELLRGLRSPHPRLPRLELGRVSVVGGGYLNPLDPAKSRLFLWEDDNPYFERLHEHFKATGHEVQSIKGAQDAALTEQLAGLVGEIRVEIASGLVPARPHSDADCERCAQRPVCGRAHLWEDAS